MLHGKQRDSSRGLLRGTDTRRLEGVVKKSRGDLNRLRMSSGDQGLNRGVLASREDNMSALEMKDVIGNGSREQEGCKLCYRATEGCGARGRPQEAR